VRLEVDAGNTLVKWRLIEAKNIVARGSVKSSEGVEVYFAGCEWRGRVLELLISCVAGSEIEISICRVFQLHNSTIRIFKARQQKVMCGVEFIYDDVSRLGVDRCLAMVAAYDKFRAGVLVIDCGSAITADLVAASGVHKGGYIFPGLGLLKGSLLAGTKNVVVANDVVNSYVLGTNTEECVDNGVHLMVRSVLFELDEIAASFDVSDILITGGDGAKAMSLLKVDAEYDKDLVFRGLAMLDEYAID
jgi:type III pantothenate kinase